MKAKESSVGRAKAYAESLTVCNTKPIPVQKPVKAESTFPIKPIRPVSSTQDQKEQLTDKPVEKKSYAFGQTKPTPLETKKNKPTTIPNPQIRPQSGVRKQKIEKSIDPTKDLKSKIPQDDISDQVSMDSFDNEIEDFAPTQSAPPQVRNSVPKRPASAKVAKPEPEKPKKAERVPIPSHVVKPIKK